MTPGRDIVCGAHAVLYQPVLRAIWLGRGLKNLWFFKYFKQGADGLDV